MLNYFFRNCYHAEISLEHFPMWFFSLILQQFAQDYNFLYKHQHYTIYTCLVAFKVVE